MMPKRRDTGFVIAVASVSGGGKTALVSKAAELLGATTLYFDDYHAVSEYPADTKKWVDDGADLNLWKTPQLARDLVSLKRGESIVSPVDERTIQSSEFIVIEEPMGRGRAEMAKSIDFVVCIDTPLDVAFVRNFLQNLDSFSSENLEKATKEELVEQVRNTIEELKDFINGYIADGRMVYIAVQEQVKNDCDLLLDGMKPIDVLADEVVKAIQTKGLYIPQR